MSRILRGHLCELEHIQFPDLESIPDSPQDDTFAMRDYISVKKPTAEASRPGHDDLSRSNETFRPKQDTTQTEPEHERSLQPEVDIESVRAEAYAQGEADARQKMRQELDTVLDSFFLAAKELNNLRTEMLKGQGDDLVRLAMVVAEQVISTELSLNEDMIIPIVDKAMKSAAEADEFHVRVHPDDVHIVQEKRPLLIAGVKGLRQIHVQEDEGITRGGCVVESNKGQVDARLESKLAEIHQQLQRAVQTR